MISRLNTITKIMNDIEDGLNFIEEKKQKFIERRKNLGEKEEYSIKILEKKISELQHDYDEFELKRTIILERMDKIEELWIKQKQRKIKQ